MPRKKSPTGTAEVVVGRTFHPHKGMESYNSKTLFLGGMTSSACSVAMQFFCDNFGSERVSVTCGPDKESGGFGIGIEINLDKEEIKLPFVTKEK